MQNIKIYARKLKFMQKKICQKLKFMPKIYLVSKIKIYVKN